jgi:hypothetical protein
MHAAGPFGVRPPKLVAATTGVLVALAVLLLASCGTPKYEYLQDDDAGAYIKVPHDWTVIDEDQMLDGLQLAPAERDFLERFGWTTVAAGHLISQDDGSLVPDPAEPMVTVIVRPLNQQEQAQLSNDMLESLFRDLETLAADQYVLLGVDPVVIADKYGGVQRVYQLKHTDGSYTTHVERVVASPDSSRVYALSMVCSPECFEIHGDDIGEVLDSWTIKEP